jgi:hypothetical protein
LIISLCSFLIISAANNLTSSSSFLFPPLAVSVPVQGGGGPVLIQDITKTGRIEHNAPTLVGVAAALFVC